MSSELATNCYSSKSSSLGISAVVAVCTFMSTSSCLSVKCLDSTWTTSKLYKLDNPAFYSDSYSFATRNLLILCFRAVSHNANSQWHLFLDFSWQHCTSTKMPTDHRRAPATASHSSAFIFQSSRRDSIQ